MSQKQRLDPYPGIVLEDDPDIEVTYPERPDDSTGLWAEVKSIARDIIFAGVMAILILVFVVQPVKVEGTSMQPRLESEERIFVNKFLYTFKPINTATSWSSGIQRILLSHSSSGLSVARATLFKLTSGVSLFETD